MLMQMVCPNPAPSSRPCPGPAPCPSCPGLPTTSSSALLSRPRARQLARPSLPPSCWSARVLLCMLPSMVVVDSSAGPITLLSQQHSSGDHSPQANLQSLAHALLLSSICVPPAARSTALCSAHATTATRATVHILQAKNPKGANHVNPPAKIQTASTATTVPVAANIKTTAGRKLQATAPAPAPEQGPAARRDMPPLPPVGPGMTAGAQAPQPGAPQGVRT